MILSSRCEFHFFFLWLSWRFVRFSEPGKKVNQSISIALWKGTETFLRHETKKPSLFSHSSKTKLNISNQMASPLVIEKQESLASDKFAKNGKNKVLHIVAKNIPFVINVASTVNLNQSPINCKVYYDWDTEDDMKEVDTLKSSPIEYTSHVNPNGLKAVVEIRLGVLSSQHEQAYFRIKLSNAAGHAWSQPIKVISKRNQVRKMLAKNEIAPANVNMSALPVPKRTVADSISETLARLEQQQKEQAALLQQLVASNKSSSSSLQPVTSNYSIPDPSDMDFEVAFAAFLKSFSKVPCEERPQKLRKAFSNINHCEAQDLQEFVTAYHTEVTLADINSLCVDPTNTSCAQDQSFDELYSDLMSSEPSSASSSPLYSPGSSPSNPQDDESSWLFDSPVFV